jgi:hypothetical protein
MENGITSVSLNPYYYNFLSGNARSDVEYCDLRFRHPNILRNWIPLHNAFLYLLSFLNPILRVVGAGGVWAGMKHKTRFRNLCIPTFPGVQKCIIDRVH